MSISYEEIISKIRESILKGEQVNSNVLHDLERIIEKNLKISNYATDELHKELLEKELKLLYLLRDLIMKYNNSFQVEKGESRKSTFKFKDIIRYLGIVIEEVPKFRGIDGNLYGPYKPGDIILINEEDYKFLKDNKYVREVKFEA